MKFSAREIPGVSSAAAGKLWSRNSFLACKKCQKNHPQKPQAGGGKFILLFMKMLPYVNSGNLNPLFAPIPPPSAFPKEFCLFQEVLTSISPSWHLPLRAGQGGAARNLWNAAIPGKKPPQGWCLQATVPKRGRANSAKRGKNSQLHPKNSPHPG